MIKNFEAFASIDACPANIEYLLAKWAIIQYFYNLFENDGWIDEVQKEEEHKHLIRKTNIWWNI